MSFKFVPLSVYFNRVSLRFSAARALQARRETGWRKSKEGRDGGGRGTEERRGRKGARTRGAGSQWLTR